jgi:hypothetical protein
MATIIVAAAASPSAYAGKKKHAFPGVEYHYVKLYLYNTNSEAKRYDQQIMRDGRYAASKVGSGIAVPNELVQELNETIGSGTPELLEGLSKCFIPRHGFVYYDSEDRPVASVSICFECEGLRFFPSREVPLRGKFRMKRALEQLAALKSIVERAEAPVLERPSLYTALVRRDPAYRSRGHGRAPPPPMVSSAVSSLANWPAVEAAWGDHSPRLHGQDPGPDNGNTVKMTDQGTRFEFSRETGALVLASIASPKISLGPLRVGMSDTEVLRHLDGYKGPQHPAEVALPQPEGGSGVTLVFGHRTLRRLVLARTAE